ncbi:hypothetical protein HI914_05717 [Erysiphe necator]|nr:hypothetical protein HI914_05717 [Erysiphe necator]
MTPKITSKSLISARIVIKFFDESKANMTSGPTAWLTHRISSLSQQTYLSEFHILHRLNHRLSPSTLQTLYPLMDHELVVRPMFKQQRKKQIELEKYLHQKIMKRVIKCAKILLIFPFNCSIRDAPLYGLAA